MRRLLLVLLCLGLGLAALPRPAGGEARSVRVVKMPRKTFENAVWMEERTSLAGGRSVQDTIQGLGGSRDSVIAFDLQGRYDLFEATIGYLESAPEGQSAVFEVLADGAVLYRSPSLSSEEEPRRIRVPVKDREVLMLRIVPDRYNATQGAVWAEPRLWQGTPPDSAGPLQVTIGGKTSLQVPEMREGRPALPVYLPLVPGTREYTVRVEYDPEGGTARIGVLRQ